MIMKISCKFEKANYNIFLVRAVTVKSLYTLPRRGRNKAKSIVSGGYNKIGLQKKRGSTSSLERYVNI